MTHGSQSSQHNESLAIRAAGGSDIPALVRLINAAFIVEQFVFDGDRINAEETRAFMQSGRFLLAEDCAKLIGCVYLEICEDRGYLGYGSGSQVGGCRGGLFPRRGLSFGRSACDQSTYSSSPILSEPRLHRNRYRVVLSISKRKSPGPLHRYV